MGPSVRLCFRPLNITRVVAAALLLVASSLKLWNADKTPWLFSLLALGEVVLALWLLTGWKAEAAVRSALIAFTGFVAYLCVALVHGWDTCGCFGPKAAPPIAVLLLDAVVVIALGATFPGRRVIPQPFIARYAFLGFLVLSPLAAATIALTASPAHLSAAVHIPTDNVIVLTPTEWVGRKLPILPDIDIGSRLDTGACLVVLVRHDCGHCTAAAPRYERMAKEFRGAPDAPAVVLIQLPPYGSLPLPAETALLQGRLTETKSWFVQTPVELLLADGVVVSVITPDGG